MLRDVPHSCCRPLPPTTMPGRYRRLVPVCNRVNGVEQKIALQNACCACDVARQQDITLQRTCLVDLDHAAVGDLLKESQQARLEVSQPWSLVLSADVVNADGPPRQCGAHQTLPKVCAALEPQHA